MTFIEGHREGWRFFIEFNRTIWPALIPIVEIIIVVMAVMWILNFMWRASHK